MEILIIAIILTLLSTVAVTLAIFHVVWLSTVAGVIRMIAMLMSRKERNKNVATINSSAISLLAKGRLA